MIVIAVVSSAAIFLIGTSLHEPEARASKLTDNMLCWRERHARAHTNVMTNQF